MTLTIPDGFPAMTSKFLLNGFLLILVGILVLPVESTWWFISQLPLHAVGAGVLCDNIPGLAGRQRRLCRCIRG